VRRRRCYIRVDDREVKWAGVPDLPQDLQVLHGVGAAAGVARYTAAGVRVGVHVGVDGGGDAEAVDPLQSHREAACSTALQAECMISSAALMAGLPGGVARVAEHRQWGNVITRSL
jgi:hypothetical protein